MITDKDGKPRGYAFIEYEREKDMKVAYMEGDAMRLEDGGRRIVVDVERGRTVKDWRPRRVAGGLGKTRVGGKEQNQRYSGRDVRANDMLAKMTDESGYNPRKRSPSPRRDHGRDRYDDRRRR
jgi:U1 small nuclear ribonucleoprotein